MAKKSKTTYPYEDDENPPPDEGSGKLEDEADVDPEQKKAEQDAKAEEMGLTPRVENKLDKEKTEGEVATDTVSTLAKEAAINKRAPIVGERSDYTFVDKERIPTTVRQTSAEPDYIPPPDAPPPAPPYGTTPIAGEPNPSATNPALAANEPKEGTPFYTGSPGGPVVPPPEPPPENGGAARGVDRH